MADSGLSINILDENDCRKLKERPKPQETSARVYPYKSNEPLKMLGKFEADLTTEDKVTSREVIHVRQGAGGSLLLSWQTGFTESRTHFNRQSSCVGTKTESSESSRGI